jgi:flagellar basal body-associated protein FliL
MPKASTPPPNVIPFTKPRAIAAIAASKPGAVAMDLPAPPRTALPVPPLASRPTAVPPQGQPRPLQPLQPHPTHAPVLSPHTSQPQPSTQPVFAPQAPRPMAVTAQPFAPPPQPVPAPAPPVQPAPSQPAVVTPPRHEPPQAPQWAHYEQLGLGAPTPSATSQQAAKWLVSAYRLLGFSILTIIVVVLVGYILSTAFFYMSSSWVVPMAVTASDERVVSLQAQVAEQQNQRDRIADELNQAERAIVAQQAFQGEFAKAIKGDLEGRKIALGKMRELASVAAGTRASIQYQNRAYAGAARKRMAEEYKAGLIDRTAMLSGKFQLAQISSSNLSLAERQAEYETKAAELEATARSLDAILANAEGDGDTALSYEVLQIKQQYEASRLELAKAVEMRDTLKASLARQDKILAALKGSAYLRAVNDGATVAFVPYGNLTKVAKGAGVYGCGLTMFWCHHVGDVIEVLPGEVSGRHPHRDKSLRGQLVEIKLDDEDAEAGADEVLFVGGKPLLL